MARIDSIPRHPDLITVGQAAKILGIEHRNSVYFKIYNQRAFKTVYRVGDEDESAFILLSRAEVEEVAKADRSGTDKKKLIAWHGRIREWAAELLGANGPVPRYRLPTPLINEYLRTHPDDPRPV